MSRKNFREGCVRQMAKRREMTIALAGNPNVGKSTLFNALTGMHQHTGNWTGKTVSNAKGYCERDGVLYTFVDVPGCYSLMARSPEEEAARDYICFQFPDAVIVVCDGTCLERNLNFVLQVMEATDRVILCINLMDEAEKKGISIDFEALESMLQIPVIGMTARSGRGMEQLFEVLGKFAEGTGEKDIKEAIVSRKQAFGQIEYPEVIEQEDLPSASGYKRSDKRVLKGTMGSGAAHGSGSRTMSGNYGLSESRIFRSNATEKSRNAGRKSGERNRAASGGYKRTDGRSVCQKRRGDCRKSGEH